MSDDTVKDALIVAGGRGTRLQPLTYDTPKPLLPFCGEPFLVGVIRRLAAAGVVRVHLVVGQDTAPFDALTPVAGGLGVELATVPEPEPLDTAGGVREVARGLDEPFLVLNGDILTDVDLQAAIRRHRETEADATLVLTRVEDNSTFGVCVRDGSRIVAFVEKPEPGTLDDDTINAGTYVLNPDVFEPYDGGRLSFERQVFPELLERGGHIESVVWDGVWADLGTPDRFRDGHAMALAGQLSWPSVETVADRGNGVRVAAGADVHEAADLRGPVLVLDGAVVGAGAVVGPNAVVGRNAQIGAGAVLPGLIAHDEVVIDGGARAIDLLAGPGSFVDGACWLGRGVVLGSGVRVEAGEELRNDERRPPAEA